MDLDFGGADLDALSLVSGVDTYGVGAFPDMSHVTLNAQGRANLSRAAHPQALQQALLVKAGLQAMRLAQQVNDERRARVLALTGQIPQFIIPASTAVGADVAAGAAFVLTPIAGVPARITKYEIARVSSPFYSITGITVARMNMFGGGVGACPADAFSPDAGTPPIENPLVGAGSPIVITGVNEDAAARPFRSNFWAVDRTPAQARLT